MSKLNYFQMPIKGKIVKIEVHGNGSEQKYYHHFACVARDEFSQPNGMIVGAKQRFGAVGEIVEMNVEFSGYLRRKPFVDQKTGEQKIFSEQKAYFNVVNE